MNVRADRERCIGSGNCVLAAPDVFDQDDEGTVVLLDPTPPRENHDAVRRAATACPSGAITTNP